MKNTVRLATLLLSVTLSISMLVSCTTPDADDSSLSDTTVPEQQSPSVESLSPEERAKILELPDGKFLKGETFNLYNAGEGQKYYYVENPDPNDIISVAVDNRNNAVEQRLGVKLNLTAPAVRENETNKISSLILAGDTTYDAFVNVQHNGMPALIQEGMFINWYDLPHINFEKEWWYKNAIRDINFGDKVFAMTGEYNLNSFTATECLAFNKDLLNELELEYPYQLVFEGKWTHDRFIEYIQAATKDLNGDGQMSYENDRYGFGGWQYEQLQALYVGYGGQTLVKDDHGMPKLNIYSEHQNLVIDNMIEVFSYAGAFYHGKEYGMEDTLFREGRLLFNDSFLSQISHMRNYECDIGFIPYPKANEQQESYYSRTANISGLTYIPITLTEDRYEIVGATLEAMAYYSGQLVLPTYFDTILTVQSTRDVESEQMIPIIRESSRFMDQAIGFNPESLVYSGQNTLASHWMSNHSVYREKLDRLKQTYSD